MHAQIDAKGGAHVEDGGREGSFVSVVRATETLGAVPAARRDSTHQKAGGRLAELTLHELGHGMVIEEHSTGIMAPSIDQTIYPGEPVRPVKFSEDDARAVRTRLEQLVR